MSLLSLWNPPKPPKPVGVSLIHNLMEGKVQEELSANQIEEAKEKIRLRLEKRLEANLLKTHTEERERMRKNAARAKWPSTIKRSGQQDSEREVRSES